MAQIDIVIASRRYAITCKDGEEEHLMRLAATLDRQAGNAARTLGTMPENRQLLMAALLVADELADARAGLAPPPPAAAVEDPAVIQAIEALADRVETMCVGLERYLASA